MNNNANLKIDGLAIKQYEKLISPDYCLRDPKKKLTNEKISWKKWLIRYVPNRIANLFARLGHALLNFKWESDRSLHKHIIVHINKGSKFSTKKEYLVVYKIFNDLISKLNESHDHLELLKKLKPAKVKPAPSEEALPSLHDNKSESPAEIEPEPIQQDSDTHAVIPQIHQIEDIINGEENPDNKNDVEDEEEDDFTLPIILTEEISSSIDESNNSDNDGFISDDESWMPFVEETQTQNNLNHPNNVLISARDSSADNLAEPEKNDQPSQNILSVEHSKILVVEEPIIVSIPQVEIPVVAELQVVEAPSEIVVKKAEEPCIEIVPIAPIPQVEVPVLQVQKEEEPLEIAVEPILEIAPIIAQVPQAEVPVVIQVQLEEVPLEIAVEKGEEAVKEIAPTIAPIPQVEVPAVPQVQVVETPPEIAVAKETVKEIAPLIAPVPQAEVPVLQVQVEKAPSEIVVLKAEEPAIEIAPIAPLAQVEVPASPVQETQKEIIPPSIVSLAVELPKVLIKESDLLIPVQKSKTPIAESKKSDVISSLKTSVNPKDNVPNKQISKSDREIEFENLMKKADKILNKNLHQWKLKYTSLDDMTKEDWAKFIKYFSYLANVGINLNNHYSKYSKNVCRDFGKFNSIIRTIKILKRHFSINIEVEGLKIFSECFQDKVRNACMVSEDPQGVTLVVNTKAFDLVYDKITAKLGRQLEFLCALMTAHHHWKTVLNKPKSLENQIFIKYYNKLIFAALNGKKLDSNINSFVFKEREKLELIENDKPSPPTLASKFLNLLGGIFNVVVNNIESIAFQSNEPQHIEWKIEKYEALISQLQSGIKKLLFPLSPNDIINKKDSELSAVNVHLKNIVKSIFKFENFDHIKNRITEEHLSDIRNSYKSYLDCLRNASNFILTNKFENSEDNKVADSIMKICEHRFKGVILTNVYRNIVKIMNDFGSQLVVNVSSSIHHAKHKMISNINKMFLSISAAPYKVKTPALHGYANSAIGNWNFGFDPHRQGNFAHQWLKMNFGKKEIDLLAFGTPTIENNPFYAEIIPDLKAMLMSYKKQGKKHLYVSLQKLNPVKGGLLLGGDETNRSAAIHGLQEKEFRNTFYAMTLSKNSSFYNQKKTGTNAKDFCNKLLSEAFEGNPKKTGIYISPQIQDDYLESTGINLKDWSANAILKIHANMFEVNDKLTQLERQNFIEIFYYFLVLEVADKLNVNSMNTSCKDDIDRGIGESTKLYGLLKIFNNEEELDKTQQDFETQMFGRALAVRKRQILEERVHRCVEVVSYAIDQKAGLKKTHEQLFPETKMNCHLVE